VLPSIGRKKTERLKASPYLPRTNVCGLLIMLWIEEIAVHGSRASLGSTKRRFTRSGKMLATSVMFDEPPR
jgi:hypothetical protein